jgi:hypothetical protein
MKAWRTVLLVLALALAAWLLLASAAAPGPGAPPDDDRAALMKEKLERVQKVLASLARDARWRISETPEYLSRSGEFERCATTLASMAAGKNADGAALAWVQMTTQCFDCHRWIRVACKRR